MSLSSPSDKNAPPLRLQRLLSSTAPSDSEASNNTSTAHFLSDPGLNTHHARALGLWTSLVGTRHAIVRYGISLFPVNPVHYGDTDRQQLSCGSPIWRAVPIKGNSRPPQLPELAREGILRRPNKSALVEQWGSRDDTLAHTIFVGFDCEK